jgi:predicted esterase
MDAHIAELTQLRPGLLFFQATLCALSGRPDRAVALLEEAVDAGQWWMERRLRNPELSALQGRMDYEAVVATCDVRFEEAQAKARPLRIDLPPAPDTVDKGLLMAFHGAPGTAVADRPSWEHATRKGWAVSLAQSSQVWGPEGFCWLDRTRTAAEVKAHLAELGRKHHGPLLLGGFSQGAVTAAWLTLTGTVPARGFIAVCPGGVIWQQVKPVLEELSAAGVKAFIVAGGKDPQQPTALDMADFITSRGGTVHLESRPELSHAFPPDFADLLSGALEFLTR